MPTRKVWTAAGSPLVATSESVRRKLSAKLGPETPVHITMRYGNPSIASTVRALVAEGCEEVLLFPQYPHYAMASWETVVARIYQEAAKQAPGMKVSCVQPFYGDADYIDMMLAVAAPALEKLLRPPALQLSWDPRATPAQGGFLACALHRGGRLLQHLLPCASDLLPGPVREDHKGICEPRQPGPGKVLDILPISFGGRTLAKAIHGFRAGAPAQGRRETPPSDLSEFSCRLPGDVRRDRHGWQRNVLRGWRREL